MNIIVVIIIIMFLLCVRAGSRVIYIISFSKSLYKVGFLIFIF